MNKKAHTPTILLFMATLVLIILALFTFASFEGKFATDSEGRSQILENIIFQEQYMIKKAENIGKRIASFVGPPIPNENIKETFRSMAKKEDLGIIELMEFFNKIENNDFEFKQINQEYFFEIKKLLLQSSSGANSIKRTLSFNITFDAEGNKLCVLISPS